MSTATYANIYEKITYLLIQVGSKYSTSEYQAGTQEYVISLFEN